MLFKYPISLLTIIRLNPLKVAATWLMVLAENVMLILLPLFIGYAIDGVLNQSFQPLMMLALILFVLVIISVVRRFYDTRVYGAIRVKLANLVERNLRGLSISTKDARLTMSRELVDFLEDDLPTLMTAVVQLGRDGGYPLNVSLLVGALHVVCRVVDAGYLRRISPNIYTTQWPI